MKVLTDLPRFKTTLPISKEEISFRPFTVKEEKVLIMANEGDDIKDVTDAVENLVDVCTFGVVKAETHSMFDVQHVFLQLRSKSISETLDLILTCQKIDETGLLRCDHKTPVALRVDAFTFRENAGHTQKIDLISCRVEMRYPTFRDYGHMYESNDAEQVYNVVAGCIERIITDEEVSVQDTTNAHDFRTFVDGITPIQFKKLEEFFETLPVLECTIKYVCAKCQKENEVTVDGVRNFFE